MANRYWVGGTTNWNNATSNWSATDGGAGGATVPGAADTAFFTALSGTVTVTWMSGVGATLFGINCTGFTGTHATGGFAKTLAGTGTVWISPVTCTITGAPNITVSSTGSTAISVTCNHATPSATNAPNFSFSGGTYALTLSGTGFRALSWSGAGVTSVQTISGTVSVYQNVTTSHYKNYSNFNITFLAAATFKYNDANSTIAQFPTFGNITINAPGATVTCTDNVFPSPLTIGTTSTLTLTAGTLAMGGRPISTGIFSSSGSSTRAYTSTTGGSSVATIALTSTTAATTVLSMATATGFTYSISGGGQLTFTRNMLVTATVNFGATAGGSTTNAPNLTVTNTAALTITNGSYFKTVDFTGANLTATGSYNACGDLTLGSLGTYTAVLPTFLASGIITGSSRTINSMTINGSGITVTLGSNLTVGSSNSTQLTAGTLDLAGFTLSTGDFSSSNTNTRAVAFGAGNIALTSTLGGTPILYMPTATGFTWTGTGGFTRNMVNTAAVYFGSTAGGSTTNAPNLTVNAGASALTITTGSYFKFVNFTGSTSSVTASYYACGDLILGSGTYTSVLPVFLATATVTSATKTLGNTTVSGSGITVTLADALTLGATSSFQLTQGTFTAANFNVTAGLFSSSNSNTRTLNMGSGTWTISGSGATAWNTATTTGLTVVPSTSTITMTSTLSKNFVGGGLTYYNLNQASTGSSALTISGSNTFNNITNTLAGASVYFTAGTTQTVSNFGLSGTAGIGNWVTIQSTTPGSQFTLSKSSGAVESKFLRIQDSNATGGANWYATDSIDTSNNTGWIFNNTNGMFAMFI